MELMSHGTCPACPTIYFAMPLYAAGVWTVHKVLARTSQVTLLCTCKTEACHDHEIPFTRCCFSLPSVGAYLVQVPGIGQEQEPLSRKNGPDGDHAAFGVIQLGPGQPLPPIAVR